MVEVGSTQGVITEQDTSFLLLPGIYHDLVLKPPKEAGPHVGVNEGNVVPCDVVCFSLVASPEVTILTWYPGLDLNIPFPGCKNRSGKWALSVS